MEKGVSKEHITLEYSHTKDVEGYPIDSEFAGSWARHIREIGTKSFRKKRGYTVIFSHTECDERRSDELR